MGRRAKRTRHASEGRDAWRAQAGELDLTPDEEEGYYYATPIAALPLFITGWIRPLHETDAGIYFSVNARFADALMPLLEPADTLWVHDYHLIPLAEELRARGCLARIRFFLHTPFPSPEVFAAVPHQRLGRALMVYDLLGFQTQADGHFARSWRLAWMAKGSAAIVSLRMVTPPGPRFSRSALRNFASLPKKGAKARSSPYRRKT